MKRSAFVLASGIATLSASCSDGASGSRGLEEPVRVLGGQFHEGELPGLPPLTSEEIAAGARAISPTVTVAEGAGGVLPLGDPARALRGRVSTDAVAVAFRFEDLGTGYWVEPARGPDPTAQGEYQWSFRAEFMRGLPPGPHRLLFAGIGQNGESGTQLDTTLCVASEVPDNGNACLATVQPPSLVVSLSWDVNADLDLELRAPNGELVDAKHPTTRDPATSALGVLDRDSNSACVVDGTRRENLVFDEPPAPGAYSVYANLFDACGEQAVHFLLSVWVASEGEEPGTHRQVEMLRRSGIELGSRANGGAKLGLFVAEFTIQ